jgi:hypothetical protein
VSLLVPEGTGDGVLHGAAVVLHQAVPEEVRDAQHLGIFLVAARQQKGGLGLELAEAVVLKGRGDR